MLSLFGKRREPRVPHDSGSLAVRCWTRYCRGIMQPLPIDAHLPEIVALARRHRRLVLVAPPGSGKTTRVAPALVVAGVLDKAQSALVLLQPRRVAARASAQRIAEENQWTMGQEVGYHIRNEKRIGPRTRIRVATEGILTRQLLNDPFLEGVGAVIRPRLSQDPST